MEDLDTKSTTENKEVGYLQVPDSTYTAYEYNYIEGDPYTGKIDWTFPAGTPTDLKGAFHIHYDIVNHLPVFSPDDLYTLFNFFGPEFNAAGEVRFNSTLEVNFTFILVTAHGTKLALMFDNPASIEKLRLFGQKYFGDWEVGTTSIPEGMNNTDKKKLMEFYDKYSKDTYSVAKAKKGFSKFLENSDLGLSLYQANDDFSEWEKINKNGSTEPCN